LIKMKLELNIWNKVCSTNQTKNKTIISFHP
jgi:hypothetical protein